MPWYRIHANHGPGHQSHMEFFDWFDKPLDKKGRKAAWDNRFDTGRYDWPIGGVELMKGLPANVLEDKIAGAENSIKHCTRLLGILRERTASIPVILVQYNFDALRANDQKRSFTARLWSDRTLLANGPSRKQAVANLVRCLNKWNPGKDYRTRDFEVETG